VCFQDVTSNPIVVREDGARLYFGDLHVHDKVHNCGSGEDPYGYARDASGLDFMAHTPGGTNYSKAWSTHVARAEAHNTPGRFTTFLGFEMQNVGGRHHQNHLFADTDGVENSRDQGYLDRVSREGRAMRIPHHSGVNWGFHDGFDPEIDFATPLIEIYSNHGQSEYYNPDHVLAYEYNRVRAHSSYAHSLQKPYWVRDAWAQGRRYGVIASGDDHMAQPGKPWTGLACVYAERNTRESLWQALRSRRTYGTTGERIYVDFAINGHPMGSEFQVGSKEGLTAWFEIHGTGSLAFVEILQFDFGTSSWSQSYLNRLTPQGSFDPMDTTLDRDCSERGIELSCTGESLYYLRLAQRTQCYGFPAYAWTSPIWVTRSPRSQRR
jgi:hypothetical protein